MTMAFAAPLRHGFLPIATPSANPSSVNSLHSINSITHLKLKSVFWTTIKKRQNQRRPIYLIVDGLEKKSEQNSLTEDEADNLGVKAALSMLSFYKREISPLLPNSCRYVPTCSEYSMIAYKKYGVVKGTILTAWRLCRCNPLGGSGFDPPRWFDETIPREQ